MSFLLVVSVLEISSAIAYNEIHEFNFFAYVVSFGWGILDSGLNNFMNITLGFEFKSKITPFSAQKCTCNIILFVLIIVESKIRTKEQFRIYFGAILVYSIFACLVMLKFEFKNLRFNEIS